MPSSLLSLLAVLGLTAAAIAGLVVWVIVQEPGVMLSVADATASGDYQAFLKALAQEVGDLIRALARML